MEQALLDLFHRCWDELKNGAAGARHAFHLGYLGTIKEGSRPAVRTVVLRRVIKEPYELHFHTDFRSGKVQDLSTSEMVAITFYDPETKHQIRIEGAARIETPDSPVSDRAWREATLSPNNS